MRLSSRNKTFVHLSADFQWWERKKLIDMGEEAGINLKVHVESEAFMQNKQTFLVECEICDRIATISTSKSPGIYICTPCWDDLRNTSLHSSTEQSPVSGHPELH
jgi:hypothetical protein